VRLDTDVRLLDASGTTLARFRAISPHGGFSLSEPRAFACQAAEGEAFFSTEAMEAWRRCFERQSRWVVAWAKQVKYADLRSGSCALRRLPVTLYTYSGDWALWWVPMPHGGAKAPYSSFHLDLAFNSATCESNAALTREGEMSADNRDRRMMDELLRVDSAIMQAIGARSREALEPLLTDSFVLRVPGAPDVNKQAFLDAITDIPGEIQSIRGEHVKAAVVDTTGIVTGVQVAVVKLTADGSVVTNRGAFTDVFERSGGTWRLVLAFSVELSTDKVE
jgi:hypothetical protein